MKKMIIVLMMTIMISACATQTFTMNGGGAAEPDAQVMQTFFIEGLGQEKEVNAVEVCGGIEKIAKVESHLRFLDGFLGAITYGIYTPRTAKVYCIQ